MKTILGNKKTTAFALLLLLTSVLLTLYIPVNAQLPEQPTPGPPPSGTPENMTVPSRIHIMARPNPVGVGQLFLVNIWTVRAPGANRKFLDYKVTITKPDGNEEILTMDSYVADGTAWFEWVADQVGEWKLKVDHPGIYFPAGRYFSGEIRNVTSGGTRYSDAVYVLPSTSKEVILTVQEEPVPSWPPSPLPTDYWTRPVTSENREWWTILGNYPWFGKGGGPLWDELYPNTNTYANVKGSRANSEYSFVPWVRGPNTPHIVWKRLYEIGGLVGGDVGQASDIYWSPNWYNRPTIILAGRGYQRVTRPSTDGPDGQDYWQCYDIRTGEIFWERPLYPGETEPRLIEYAPSPYTYSLGERGVLGVVPKSGKPSLMSISGGYMRKYDPMNGQMILNESIAPLTGRGGEYYMNGYALAVQNLGGGNYRLINWTTMGSADNFADRVISNTSYAMRSLPSRIDWETGLGGDTDSISRGGVRWGQRVESYDLLTGEELWEIEVEEPEFSSSSTVVDHGKIAFVSMQGYYMAYDLRTGNLAWKTELLDYPWDQSGWGTYGVISCYGRLYWGAPSGIYAIDWETGNIDWKFEVKAEFPYETVYQVGSTDEGDVVYPFHAPGLAADGKLFIYSMHHSPEPPFFRGQPMMAINATTGELIWKLGGFAGAGQHTRTAMQIRLADGYLALGARDGYMYVIGKGKSETTVTAPDVALPKGTALTIKGTVLDLSPAQPATPAVSKESMETQMQYLHLQMPIDGIHHNVTITGVPVVLTALGPDGSHINIGTTTTNGYFGTFSYAWTPPEEGTYEIIASFAGDESYSSSAAATAVTVAEAPEPYPEPPEYGSDEWPEYPEAPTYTAVDLAIIVAVVIAIVLGIISLLDHRRLRK